MNEKAGSSLYKKISIEILFMKKKLLKFLFREGVFNINLKNYLTFLINTRYNYCMLFLKNIRVLKTEKVINS